MVLLVCNLLRWRGRTITGFLCCREARPFSKKKRLLFPCFVALYGRIFSACVYCRSVLAGWNLLPSPHYMKTVTEKIIVYPRWLGLWALFGNRMEVTARHLLLPAIYLNLAHYGQIHLPLTMDL